MSSLVSVSISRKVKIKSIQEVVFLQYHLTAGSFQAQTCGNNPSGFFQLTTTTKIIWHKSTAHTQGTNRTPSDRINQQRFSPAAPGF